MASLGVFPEKVLGILKRKTEEPRLLAIREGGVGLPPAGPPGSALSNSREEAKEPRLLAFRPFHRR